MKLKIRQMTGVLLLVTAFIWAFYDLYAWLYGVDATISVLITDFSRRSVPFVFIIGFLAGHWFFPAKGSGE